MSSDCDELVRKFLTLMKPSKFPRQFDESRALTSAQPIPFFILEKPSEFFRLKEEPSSFDFDLAWRGRAFPGSLVSHVVLKVSAE